jgi:hypothetical protein
MVFEPNGDITFSSTGLSVMQAIAELHLPPAEFTNLPRRTPFLFRHRPIPPDGPEPCGRAEDDWGIYVALERDVAIPFEAHRLICPRR